MAFLSKTRGGGTNAANTGRLNTLDTSQIEKMKEAGYMATPISSDPAILENTVPTSRQVLPGVAIPGYQDGRGNFFVVEETGTVNQVITNGNFPDRVINQDVRPPIRPQVTPIPPTGGGGGVGTPVPPILPPNPPVPPPPPPVPPSNFGSGKIFTRFELGDIVPNQQEVVTRALWSQNVGNLTTFYTSSAQTATQQRYYYEVFNSASGDCGAEAQFSVAYGNKNGSGSADEGGQINDTPSRAIYGQYRLLCLDGDTSRFTIGGTTTDHIYVVNVNRARMREYLDEGNLELNLHHLNGNQFGGNNNNYTASNVLLKTGSGGDPTGEVLRLIDDSSLNSATITEAGEVYDMVSGSIEDGVYNAAAPHVFGKMYRRLGVVVLDAGRLNQSASFNSVTGSEVAGDNAYKIFTAISGAAIYTDASGDKLGFAGRSAEKVKSTHYFVRVKNAEYNFSNNPTYVTGSEGDLSEPTFINDPKTYITTVGMYNPRKELVAVAKVSKAIQKSFTKEALIKIKLDF